MNYLFCSRNRPFSLPKTAHIQLPALQILFADKRSFQDRQTLAKRRLKK